MKLFTEIIYTNNTKSLRATDEFLLRAWTILCEHHVGKLSADAIRALLSVSENTKLSVSSLTANQLCDPFDFGNDGAAIYPDEFQPWESDMLSLCERNGMFFTLTFEGEAMKSKMLTEINKKHEQELALINSNKHIHPLEV